MAFSLSDAHIDEYHRHGMTVFRQILPTTLIRDLRRVTERGRALARERSGGQAQRLQPISAFELDAKPFEDYENLPELRDALRFVLSDRHTPAGLANMGVFYEPAEAPYCTQWHRDITADSHGVDAKEFRKLTNDPTFFVQVNCALYTDACTWVVPGSDGRPNVAGEAEAAANYPTLEGESNEERERRCLTYCQSMPGGVQLILEPGDYCLYRPNGWHIGSYTPYRRRETIHSSVWKPETHAWYARWTEARKAQRDAAPAAV